MAGRFNLRFRSDCLFSKILTGGGDDNSLLISKIHSIYKADDSSSAAFVVPIGQVLDEQTNFINTITMKKVIYNSGRAAYESPCCEILSLQAEGVLCQSPSYGEAGAAGADGVYLESEDY